jgi:hypothetical protein
MVGGVAEEKIGGHFHVVAHRPAQQLAQAQAPRLADRIEAGDLQRGIHPGVCRLGNSAISRGADADHRLARAARVGDGVAAARSFADADDPAGRDDFHDRPQEVRPVATRGGQKRRIGQGDRRHADFLDHQVAAAAPAGGRRFLREHCLRQRGGGQRAGANTGET